MATMESDSSAGARFSALLNPIRDIAASWGVDIAKELSEYAEYLGIDISANMTSTDNAASSVDFAQAALLVSGSASIYSRKVEHLYSLVYVAVSALNKIRSKEKAVAGNLKSPTQNDIDADALLEFDEEDFLTLDDDIPQADPKTITLDDEPDARKKSMYRDETLLPPVPPMLAFRPAESASALGRPSLRISNSHTHPSGALIMQGCSLVTENLDSLPSKPQPEMDPDVTQPFGDFDANNADEDDFGDAHHPIPMSPNDAELDIVDDKTDANGNVSNPPLDSSKSIMETAALYGVTTKAPKDRKSEREKDPFTMLDPHQSMPIYDKPLKVGKTYRRPRTRARVSQTLPYQSELAQDMCMVDALLGEIPQSASVRTYVSVPNIRRRYADILKQRSVAKRKLSLQNQLVLDPDQDVMDDSGGNHIPEVDPDEGEEFPGLEYDHEEDNVFDSPEHLRLPDHPGVGEDDPPELGLFPDAENERRASLEYMASSFEETCRKHLEQTAWMWEQRTTDVHLIRRVEDWKDRIQPLLQEEELRSQFDIMEYGQGVLRKLARLEVPDNAQIGSKDIFKSKARYEVSRMFLATLQLANDYSVEIVPPPKPEVSIFHLRQLTSYRGTATEGELRKISEKFESPSRGVKTSKRARQAGSTPKSARRPPLRPRLEPQATSN